MAVNLLFTGGTAPQTASFHLRTADVHEALPNTPLGVPLPRPREGDCTNHKYCYSLAGCGDQVLGHDNGTKGNATSFHRDISLGRLHFTGRALFK